MKRMVGIVIVVALSALLTACPFDGNDAAKLRNNLGPYQYIGLDPQLSFIVQKADFEPPPEKYSPATLTYTVSMKQNNKAFPLNTYGVAVIGSIQNNAGHELDTVRITGKVVNGVLSASDVDKLYGSKVSKLPANQVSQLTLKIKSYTWGPIVNFKPYKGAATK